MAIDPDLLPVLLGLGHTRAALGAGFAAALFAFLFRTALFDPSLALVGPGDGAFAHKSYERIMALKDRGATILFCSHSLYHVEEICDQDAWVQGGRIRHRQAGVPRGGGQSRFVECCTP